MPDLPDPGIVGSAGQTCVGRAECFDITRRGESPALCQRCLDDDAAEDGRMFHEIWMPFAPA